MQNVVPSFVLFQVYYNIKVQQGLKCEHTLWTLALTPEQQLWQLFPKYMTSLVEDEGRYLGDGVLVK